MNVSMTDDALAHIQQKGGRVTVDLVCISS